MSTLLEVPLLSRNKGGSLRITLLYLSVSIFFLVGCASELTYIQPRLPEQYEILGHASGTACGSLLIGPTAYNFIPAMLNSRVERAYQAAVESVPGSKALTNVTLNENWYWWVIGSMRCTTITGEAIRCDSQRLLNL